MKPTTSSNLTQALKDSIRLEELRNFTKAVKVGKVKSSVYELEKVKEELVQLVAQYYPNDRVLWLQPEAIEEEMMFI